MGQVIVRDLVEFGTPENVLIADFNLDNAEKLKKRIGNDKVSTAFVDIRDKKNLVEVLKDATVVINSTPYYFNINVMEAALEASCHYMDLGGLFHVTKKQLDLNDAYRSKGLLAILGMGAAPGLTNVMAARGAGQLDEVASVDIVIGAVDFNKSAHPLQPPYALDTILDEYTKEPMVFENGEYKAKPPMSGEKSVQFPDPVGRTKAILTLHSEVLTIPMTYKHKGIRDCTFRLGLPLEFHEKLRFLVELGFGESESMQAQQGPFVPRQVLAKMLERFPLDPAAPDDAEVIRVDVSGKKGAKETMVRLETTVYADKKWQVSSGALDTGVPPSIVAQMLVNGDILERGVLPPEICIPHAPFFKELERRSITIIEAMLSPQMS